MRRSKLATQVVTHSLLGAMLAAGSVVLAADAAPTAKWYDSIGVSGYLQTSALWNLNDPRSRVNTGRQFDTDSNSFNLNTFLLQIAKPVGDADHYGFTARLRTGKDANSLNVASGGSGSNSTGAIAVQEAYITYAVPVVSKLQLIAGKFVTNEGFEGIDTVNNPNFSEGLLFTYAEPLTHTGVKANYTLSDKANVTLGLVNGWDLTTDNNDAKTILWQVATTPMKQITWSFQGLYGKEVADPSNSQRLSLDTVLGFAATDKLSLNLQGNWGQQSNDPATVRSQGTTHWEGLGLWASLITSSMFTESLRFEVMSDQNGAGRFFGGAALPNGRTVFSNGSQNQTVKEITLTHKTMLTSTLGNRLEYRHDWSNQAYFENKNGPVRNQNTISTDFFVTF